MYWIRSLFVWDLLSLNVIFKCSCKLKLLFCLNLNPQVFSVPKQTWETLVAYSEKKYFLLFPKFAVILLAVFLCSHTFILFINVADVSKLTSPIIILLNGANLRWPMKIKAKLCHTAFSSTFQKGRDYPAALKALLSQWEKNSEFYTVCWLRTTEE